MASIDVGIHPDPAGITTRLFLSAPPAFSTLEFNVRDCHVRVYVHNRAVLDALQAALDEIRADMDASAPLSVFYDGAHEGCDTDHRHNHSTAPLVDALTPAQHALVDAVLAEAVAS
jgi:hypothetical protein